MTEKTRTFDVLFEGTARATGKMRNEITVTSPVLGEPIDLATDEGGFHGGDDTAPPPLALFTAALTGCLMTQIRAFAHRLDLEIDRLNVKTTLLWRAEQTGNAPYVSQPVRFGFDLEIDSSADAEDLVALIAHARKGCFIEQTLAMGVDVHHRLKVDGAWVEV